MRAELGVDRYYQSHIKGSKHACRGSLGCVCVCVCVCARACMCVYECMYVGKVGR